MAEQIGRLARRVVSELKSKCERCKKRPAWKGRKWCRKCQSWWDRHNHPQETKKHLVSMLGSRYASAKLFHLPKAILQTFQSIQEHEGVLLWGDIGVGKTYCLSALARRFYVSGWDVLFSRWYELMLRIRRFNDDTDELQRIEPYIEVDKLFIDDLGIAYSQESDYSVRTLELILEKRLADYRPTFVSSNQSLEHMAENFDGRIASRLQESCHIIHTMGRDRRVMEI